MEFSPRLDSLIQVLDRTIELRPVYYSQKRYRLDSLRTALHNSIDMRERFGLLEVLFDEYNNFSIDTAMIAATHARAAAEQLRDEDSILRAMLMQAEGLRALAKYQESLKLLDSVSARAPESFRLKLLGRYAGLYYSLKDNAFASPEYKIYRDSVMHYRNQLAEIDKYPVSQAIYTLENLKDYGNYSQAINAYHEFILSHPDITPHERAILQYIVADAYDKSGSNDTAMQYLAEAAIYDLSTSDRKYNALPMLAKKMYQRGDIQHAYDYIMYSLADIRASNAYSRMPRVLEALPIISHTYDLRRKQLEQKEHVVRWVLAACIALVLLMLVVIYVDNKKLTRERQRLQQRNTVLADENQAANEQNESLVSAGKAREDYIGLLCRTCSDYINIMAQEHNSLMKIVKNGKMADIERMLLRMQAPDRMANFQKMFDQGIINLFPDYIDRFNQMLQEEHRIVPPTGELTPELRIFALMRLGITDTGQIASFLNYSPQTVYNYRFKIHSHLQVERDEFYETLQAI